MAIWAELTIHAVDGDHTGDAACRWMETHHPDLLAEKSKRGRFVVVLTVANEYLAGDVAVAYLIDRFGADVIAFQRKETARRDERVKVQRKLRNVVKTPGPTYVLELSLGDVDTMFEPMGGGDPWTDLGVKQRLQALGYLYTPLTHPAIAAHARRCFAYYKRVRDAAEGGPQGNDELKTQLQREIRGNLVTAVLPESGTILATSRLPGSRALGAIRFPGGYCVTRSPTSTRVGGDHVLNASVASNPGEDYEFRIGDPRHLNENKVFTDNLTVGRFPLVANVVRRWPDGRTLPAADAPVLFKLVDPQAIPPDSPLAAPPLPNKVMNYALDGLAWVDDTRPGTHDGNKGLNAEEWKAIHRIAHAAHTAHAADDMQAQTLADQWVDTWAAGAATTLAAVQAWWVAGAPYPRMRFTVLDPLNFGRLEGKLAVAFADGPKPTGPLFNALTDPEWAAFKVLAARALADNGNDPALAAPVARGWLRTWHAANVSWTEVSPFWGNQHELPYPMLRPTFVAKAKERVGYILAQRLVYDGRATEVSNIGQKRFMDRLMATIEAAADPKDPQRWNAPEADHGGRGGAAITKIFDTAARQARFHSGAAHGDLALATLPGDARTHPHAVQAIANARGYAGVVFEPSRCGGDRYRLCAYIDPLWLKRKGASSTSVRAHSGTMVVWRNIRINRYLRLPNPHPTPMSAGLQALLDYGTGHPQPAWNPNDTTTASFTLMRLGTAMIDLDVFPEEQPEDEYAAVPGPVAASAPGGKPTHMRYRPVAVVPTGFATQFRRAWCELIDDAGAIETMSRDLLRETLAVGTAAWDASGQFAKRVDWPTLVLDDPTSPFLMTLRSFAEYNALRLVNFDGTKQGTHPALSNATDDPEKALYAMAEAMLEHLAGGGVLPGITIVQIPRGSTWDFRALDIKTTITSGYGTASRAFWLSHTRGVYHGDFWAYSATANALHEVGHVLGLCHQPPAGADLEPAHQSPIMEAFQTPTAEQTVCVMSYSGCYGDYCGRCILQLRGWASSHDADPLYP
jgi:hypothetical protein